MLPTRESFEARKLFRRQINDRLIDDLQLTLLDCLGEFGADVRVAVTAHGGVEDFDAIGAGALGAVHRKLGILQQIAFGRLIFIPCGDSDGAGQDDFLIGERDRRAQRAADAFRKRGKITRFPFADEQHRELIAADARDGVVRSEVALQAARDSQKQAVAAHETERGIDALELVEVDEDHGRANAAIGLGTADDAFQAIEKQFAIGKAGQAAIDGIVEKPLVGALHVGHVAQQADAAKRAAVGIRDARGLEFKPAPAVVGMAEAEVRSDADA